MLLVSATAAGVTCKHFVMRPLYELPEAQRQQVENAIAERMPLWVLAVMLQIPILGGAPYVVVGMKYPAFSWLVMLALVSAAVPFVAIILWNTRRIIGEERERLQRLTGQMEHKP